MGPMTEAKAQILAEALIPTLIDAKEQLEQIERYLHPIHIEKLRASCAASAKRVKKTLDTLLLTDWPGQWRDTGELLLEGSGHLKIALSDFIAASKQPENTIQQIQALRGLSLAEEVLYPLCPYFPAINRIFLEPGATLSNAKNAALLSGQGAAASTLRLVSPTGLRHNHNDRPDRGGYTLYVPEDYAADRAWPLIIALHGGNGHGRSYLWAWLKFARTRGALLLSPTSLGNGWSLLGKDIDRINLLAMIKAIRDTWSVDSERILLAGLSDGATYSLLFGLAANNPCTHFAPLSGMLHPANLQNGNIERIRGKPVYLLHGALDGLFPVAIARETRDLLSSAGADLTYREVPDLGHNCARDEHAALLDWFGLPNRAM